jgi:elongation factor G
VTISVPNAFTSNVLRLINGHRGQVLGYEAKANWHGWDEVQAQIPQAEMQNLIVELRSLTMGVGSFCWQFDHLQEVPDKVAEKLLAKSGNGNSH